MAFQLELPDIGEGVVEAEIMKWFVAEGDEVAEDQPLVEVMTDKATVTIPSPKRGRVLRRCWKEGEIATVHSALIERDLEAAGVVARPKAATAAAPAAPATRPSVPARSPSPPALPAPPAPPAPVSLAAQRPRGARALATPA